MTIEFSDSSVQAIVGIIVILSSIASGFVFIVMLWRDHKQMKAMVEKELTPNNGNSLKDRVSLALLAVNEQGKTMESCALKLDRIEQKAEAEAADADKEHKEIWKALAAAGLGRREDDPG